MNDEPPPAPAPGNGDRPAARHLRVPRAGDEAVAAVGKLTEALETTERARGHLYAFHQLTGHADLALDSATRLLREAGHPQLADAVETELIGRNVVADRWTFQIVEEYDDDYYASFRRWEQTVRASLLDGRRHIYEAEMKEARRTRGHPSHRAAPDQDSS